MAEIGHFLNPKEKFHHCPEFDETIQNLEICLLSCQMQLDSTCQDKKVTLKAALDNVI